MPLEAADLAQIATLLDTKFNEVPGMVKRIAAETVEAKMPKPEVKAEVKPEVKVETKPEPKADEDIRAEFRKLQNQLEDEKVSAAVGTAVATVSWFDPEMAINAIKSKVQKTENGKYVVPVTKQYGEVTKEELVPLEEGVKDFAAKKPFLVNTGKATGGTGAGKGGAGTDFTALPTTMKELMANPNKFAEITSTEAGRAHVDRVRASGK